MTPTQDQVIGAIDAATTEIRRLYHENERLRGELKKHTSDVTRLVDFIRGESPEEMLRLADAAKKAKGVQILQAYIASLWELKKQ